MTLSIIVPNATFTKYARRVRLPFIEEAKSYLLLGGNASESIKNRAGAPLGTPAIIGSPVYGDGFATISQSNGFNLGYINGHPMTLLVVAKYSGSGNAGLIGHWPAATPAKQDLMYFQLPSSFGGAIDGSLRGLLSGAPVSGFCFYAMTYDGANMALYSHNGATMLSSNVAFASANQPDGNLRVGGSTFGTVTADVACAAAWQRVLSAAEILEVYNYLKPFMAKRLISVT